MTTRRVDRVNVLLRQDISKVLSRDLNDPRLSSVISVTRVDCSPDLRNARVYVSVLGETNHKNEVIKVLKAASGFVHRTLRKEMDIRTVPFLDFRLDESIEQGAEMLEFIKINTSSDTASVEAED